MKYIFKVLASVLLFAGCKEHKDIIAAKKNNFTSIEFTYRDQLDSFFDFRVDSSRMFIYPKTWDTVQYGMLPDSLFQFVDSSISLLLEKTPITKSEAISKDSLLFGLILIADNDTIRLLQTNTEISSTFLKMIPPLKSFANKKHFTLNNAAMLLQSKRMTIPTPEPILIY